MRPEVTPKKLDASDTAPTAIESPKTTLTAARKKPPPSPIAMEIPVIAIDMMAAPRTTGPARELTILSRRLSHGRPSDVVDANKLLLIIKKKEIRV